MVRIVLFRCGVLRTGQCEQAVVETHIMVKRSAEFHDVLVQNNNSVKTKCLEVSNRCDKTVHYTESLLEHAQADRNGAAQ